MKYLKNILIIIFIISLIFSEISHSKDNFVDKMTQPQYRHLPYNYHNPYNPISPYKMFEDEEDGRKGKKKECGRKIAGKLKISNVYCEIEKVVSIFRGKVEYYYIYGVDGCINFVKKEKHIIKGEFFIESEEGAFIICNVILNTWDFSECKMVDEYGSVLYIRVKFDKANNYIIYKPSINWLRNR